MSSSNRAIRFRSLVSVFATYLSLAASIAAAKDFHITFGTTGDPSGRNADGVSFVVETYRGDIVVAGSGGSFSSDTGTGNYTSPLIARVSPDGELQWQRVYGELANQRITGLVAAGESQYVVLEPSPPGGDLRSLLRPVTLRRIDERGNVSDEIATIQGFWVSQTIPVVERDASYFLFVAKMAAAPMEIYSAPLELIRLDLEGRITRIPFPDGPVFIKVLQHVSGLEFVFAHSGQARRVVIDGRETSEVDSEIKRLNLSSGIERLFTLVNKACRDIAVFQGVIFCTEYVPYARQAPLGAVVAYTSAGRELWRRNFEPENDIAQMRVLESGDVLVAYRDGMNGIVDRYNVGGDLVWRRSVESTGPYMFLRNIAPLSDGRIAILGSTGAFGAFVSTDTDAVLIVADASSSDAAVPDIVSKVADSSLGTSTR